MTTQTSEQQAGWDFYRPILQSDRIRRDRGPDPVAYSNTFTASFHFDDDAAISENPNIKRVSWETVNAVIRTNRPGGQPVAHAELFPERNERRGLAYLQCLRAYREQLHSFSCFFCGPLPLPSLSVASLSGQRSPDGFVRGASVRRPSDPDRIGDLYHQPHGTAGLLFLSGLVPAFHPRTSERQVPLLSRGFNHVAACHGLQGMGSDPSGHALPV